MQFNCYGNRVRTIMDAAEFAAFRAEDKYVFGVLPDGVELMLLDGVTLKAIEQAIPTVMRVSRATLVARQYVLGVGKRGTGQHRNVLTAVGEYRLARRLRAEPFTMVGIENAQARKAAQVMRAPMAAAYACH